MYQKDASNKFLGLKIYHQKGVATTDQGYAQWIEGGITDPFGVPDAWHVFFWSLQKTLGTGFRKPCNLFPCQIEADSVWWFTTSSVPMFSDERIVPPTGSKYVLYLSVV
jgi:hypothetical protein